jgi:DNA repair protein RadD
MSKKLSPSLDDKNTAAIRLLKIFKDDAWEYAAGELHDYIETRSPGIEKIIAGTKSPGISELLDDEIPKTIVDMFGAELFEGLHGAKLREMILEKFFEQEKYDKIKDIYLAASNSKIANDEKQKFATGDKKKLSRIYLDELKNNRKKYSWRSGKYYAREFVSILKIPEIFAGIPGDPKEGNSIEVTPRSKIKKMKNFQKNMANQVLELLYQKDPEKNRTILTLPTGAGKTRIAVEAIVEYLKKEGVDRNILWIAQSQEICEQAVLCFKQIWEEKGEREILNIFRVWDDRPLPNNEEHGIIVGSYQKLVSQKQYLHYLSDRDLLSGVFIDEAHHAVANSYVEILNELGMSGYSGGVKEHDTVPLIGLTATPERSKSSETTKLHRMFGNKIIYPNSSHNPTSDTGSEFDHRWKELVYVKQKLTDKKYLAEAKFHEIDPGRKDWRLDLNETKQFDSNDDQWMKKIVTDELRNKNIADEIIKWAKKDKKILYFGTNLAQSNAMSHILELNGIHSACITGDTRYATRKMFINVFNSNEKKIQVLCNYNVLSTGFDSPKIDVVIIARPTGSVVSYQQMVGRGLRGEEFGGNVGNRCDIVTVKDNIVKYNNERVDLGWQLYKEELTDADSFSLPAPDEEFTNDELYEKFKFQKQGGIRATNKHNFVALIDALGSNYNDKIYQNAVTYVGTGENDQTFTGTPGHFNQRVIDPDSILMYFTKNKSNNLVFKFQVKYLDWSKGISENKNKKKRKIIQFRLAIVK